jgi:hypothetical protein
VITTGVRKSEKKVACGQLTASETKAQVRDGSMSRCGRGGDGLSRAKRAVASPVPPPPALSMRVELMVKGASFHFILTVDS